MRLLDLFCGAGGCSVGYSRAGFAEIAGVDHKPQPRYPFPFYQGNAMNVLPLLLDGRKFMFRTEDKEWLLGLDDFDVIHASPPCQRYSRTKSIHRGRSSEKEHPDLIDPVRDLLIQTDKPFVMENVPGSPLRDPLMLCGTFFGLRVQRHRLFECSQYLWAPGQRCWHPKRGSFVQTGRPLKEGDWVIVAGHISGMEVASKAMGIDWMTRDELVQAIPPAYTEFIGKQLLDACGV